MEKINKTEQKPKETYSFSKLREATPDQISNAVLARLAAEVRNEESFNNQKYNRFHNRHNR
jgi:hypothetical protein